jgi:hypothetical protein
MHLGRAHYPSAALTVFLLLGGHAAESNEDIWGAVGRPQYDGRRQPADYGAPSGNPYDPDPRFDWAPAAFADQFQEPSRSFGDRPFPGRDGSGYGDHWQKPPAAWDQGGFHGSQHQVSPGAYPDYGGAQPFNGGPTWQGAPDYRQGYGDYAFRPLGESDGPDAGPGPTMGSAAESRGGPRSRDAYPGYRFRGDPPGYAGRRSFAPYDMGYRFRPLTDQDQRRPDPGVDRWSSYPRGSGSPPLRSDPVFEPEAAYGFEPNPWRGH